MSLELLHEPCASSAYPPLLFIHGAYHSAWCWKIHFMPYFARHNFNSYALSLSGHGASSSSKKIFWLSISDYVHDVYNIIQQLPTPPILIGHSMGGFVIQRYLELFGAKNPVPAVILAAPIPHNGSFNIGWRVFKRYPWRILKAAFTRNFRQLLATPQITQSLIYSSHLANNKLQTYHNKLEEESRRMMLDTCFLQLPNVQVINNLSTSLMLITGANDALITPSDLKPSANAYNTKLHIVEDLAHNLMLDTHWQVAADHMLYWLKQQFPMP